MNPGLPQGFVRFGSVAHKILLFIHEHGKARHTDLVEEGIASEFAIGLTLTRLRRAKFIRRLGRLSAYETGDRTQAVYAIIGAKRDRELESVKNIPHAVRTQKYRDRQRLRVNSVFNFRGAIDVK